MRYSNFGSFGNMHIRNSLLGYPRRGGRNGKRSGAGFPWMSLVIVLSVLSAWVKQPITEAQKDQDYQTQLEIWRAHPEFVAHPIRSK